MPRKIDLISQHRDWGRTRLSEELCRCWDWRNAYDRLGRPVQIIQSSGSGPQSSVSFSDDPATPSVTNHIARRLDTIGRSAGFSLGNDYAVSYSFDTYGRFSAVTAPSLP